MTSPRELRNGRARRQTRRAFDTESAGGWKRASADDDDRRRGWWLWWWREVEMPIVVFGCLNAADRIPRGRAIPTQVGVTKTALRRGVVRATSSRGRLRCHPPRGTARRGGGGCCGKFFAIALASSLPGGSISREVERASSNDVR